jgi:hypothetical protein
MPRKGQYHGEVLNQFILAKAGLPAYFDEQLPYQPVMAV